ncbi:MAG: dihydropteroate synthase [Lentisphaerae bacterium]|nr:dihydropteroate synthase [Lentisphaerota bacterium]
MFDLSSFLENIPRPAVMGIVNASGESFSERGRSSADSALARALAHLDCGADILDIGGESTRPGAKETAEELELNRVLPVLRNLRKVHPETVLSVDTRHGRVAQAALQNGVQIINDVSMLRKSPEIADLVAQYGAALILSHSRGTPENMQAPEYCSYPDGVAETVAVELAAAKEKALKAGVRQENIMLDPGFGFAKNADQCWELLENLEKISPLSNLMIGVSRKSFLGALTGENDPVRRSGETLAVELLMAAKGVGVIRTHGVRELHNALLVLSKLQSGEGGKK